MSDFTLVHRKPRAKHSIERPYCSTCRKANKSFAEYTSHWTKSSPGPEGTIICPIILNTICSRCNKKGHWAKYCKIFTEDVNYVVVLTTTENNVVLESTTENNVVLTTTENTDDEYIDYNYLRPRSPDYPPPDYIPEYQPIVEKKLSYSDIVSKTVDSVSSSHCSEISAREVLPDFTSIHNIHHDWSDDEYWNE